MLIRSLTWTAVLAFTGTWMANPSLSQADQPGYAALSPSVANAFSAFVDKPTPAKLQAVRGLLAADVTYNPYSDDLTQLKNLLSEGKNREVTALLVKSQPNLLLSPRAHRLAVEAARRIGDKSLAAAEAVLPRAARTEFSPPATVASCIPSWLRECLTKQICSGRNSIPRSRAKGWFSATTRGMTEFLEKTEGRTGLTSVC